MIPCTTFLSVSPQNEIRRRGNMSKQELPLIPPSGERLQLRPPQRVSQSEVGGAEGSSLPHLEKATGRLPPLNPTRFLQTFPRVPPSVLGILPPPRVPGQRKEWWQEAGSGDGMKTGCPREFTP